MTESAVAGHYHPFAHNKFNGQITTASARILNFHAHIIRNIMQPDDSGVFIGTSFESGVTIPLHHFMNNVYLRTDAVAATAPVRIELFQGALDTGTILLDKYFPASNFPANSEIQLSMPEWLEWVDGVSYNTIYSSANTFSLKTNAAGTATWSAADISLVTEDDMLQTTEWISGNNFQNRQWKIENNKIYVYNYEDNTQTGTFQDNIQYWDTLTSEDFAYEKVDSNRIVRIPENKQMIVYGSFELEGTLELDGGSLVLIH